MSKRTEKVGAEIRLIANEIEKLDPNMAPVFTGFEHTGARGEPVRGHFQKGLVIGVDASLAHARQLLAETQLRVKGKP